MRTSRKIWLGVGAFVVVDTAATAALAPLVAGTPSGLSARRVEPADGLAMDRILTRNRPSMGKTQEKQARRRVSPGCRPTLPLVCASHCSAVISWSETS